ncbi:HEAT repeat domain-containing protein [Nostoc sp. 106C]|uniref:HEAT repeat domain-containing protein n=1 Tax=Nostoc sp. 106C TaxID=1932667 RepID=UPI000A398405|nr:HEAT repeat domain-containing protein [Nostoc sp. 106C]OUL30340.1 hypothetical protein BV375_14255 [Nostoc sp. 106C]
MEFYRQLPLESNNLLQQLAQLSDEQLQRDYLNYLQWTEPITQMLAQLEDEAQALRVVRLALEVDLRLGAKLAGAVKPEFQVQTVGLVTALQIPEVLKVQLLGMTRSDYAILYLVEALNDEESCVPWSATFALGEIKSEIAVRALIKALNHQNSDVYWLAPDILGQIGSQLAEAGLIHALNHQNPWVRGRAAEALAEIGREEIVYLLIPSLRDKDPYVVKMAASTLGKIGDDIAVPALIEVLQHENSKVRIQAAAFALGNIGSDAAVPFLIEAMNNQNEFVQESAATILGELGSEKAIPSLIHALNYGCPLIKLTAATALGKIGSQAAIAALVEALNHYLTCDQIDDSDDTYITFAAEALEKKGNPEALPYLANILLKPTGYKSTFIETVFNTIAAIQHRCGYYNYAIAHS